MSILLELLELRENKQGTVNLNVSFSLVSATSLSDRNSYSLELKKLPHYSKVTYDRDEIEVVFADLPREFSKFDNVDSIVEKVQNILEKGNIDIDTGWQFIFVEKGLPPYELNFYDIRIKMDSSFNLQGIDKLIGVCDTLTFENIDTMDPSPVLSILKLQQVNNLSFEVVGQTPKWCRILEKYFDSSKNINKCKSELKEAGLEEYAQL